MANHERYVHPQLIDTWSDANYLSHIIAVEQALLDARGTDKRRFEPDTIGLALIRAAEYNTNHEVQAIIDAFDAQRGDSATHRGLTSSDATDTARVLQQRHSLTTIKSEVATCLATFASMKAEVVTSPVIGRTHGRYAVPMPLHHRINVWMGGIYHINADLNLLSCFNYSKLRGAVGTGTHITEQDEVDALGLLHLKPTPNHVTQIIPRHSWRCAWDTVNAGVAWAEKILEDLRLLSMDGIDEWTPPLPRTSSSTMVHKKNPTYVETTIGICRMVRHTHAALTSGTDWLERDLTQSSVERIMLPMFWGFSAEVFRRLNQCLINGKFDADSMLINLVHAIESGCLDESAYLATATTEPRAQARTATVDTMHSEEVLNAYLNPKR